MSDKLINLLQPNEIDESKLTSAFIICIHHNKLLLGYNNWRKQWEIPAGKREINESIEQTAKREFLEETHHSVSNIKLIKIAEIKNQKLELRYRAIFLAEVNNFLKFKKINGDEMDQIQLFNFSDLDELNFDELDYTILKKMIINNLV